jgi:DNA mismatch endonuclease (patch repair protein)
MADIVSEEKRSKMMAKIKAKDTKPEIKIRKALHALGFRYKLHDSKLPGKPDLVLTKYNAVIEVNGCFWHGHDCPIFRLPKSRTDYWKNKINRNIERDYDNFKKLLNLEWRILIVWGCTMRGKKSLEFEKMITTIDKWIKEGKKYKEISGTGITNTFYNI